MPEISEQKQKNENRVKSGCGPCACCFIPRKKIKEDHSVTQYESLDQASSDALMEKKLHKEDLPEPLKCGSCISITGSILPECTRFAINLMCGKTENSDIAMHLNPRIAQRYVVRNSRVHGKWEEEETTSIARYELARNSQFFLDIVVTESEFMVSINGKHVCAFGFRLPVQKICSLMVEGAVDVKDVQYKTVTIYPYAKSVNSLYAVPTGDGSPDKQALPQLEVPVTASLPKGFQKNWQLEINGRVKILPSAFYINLQQGSQLWPHPLIPLHLNPRFNKSSFVRNAWVGGKWGKEECCPTFPFYPGENFALVISMNDEEFSVLVNGQLIGEFRFRSAVDKIDTVYIHGDVVVKSLYMKEHVDNLYFHNSDEDLEATS